MSGLFLDADALHTLDVALGTAVAMGDEHCGTEHLLCGIITTSSGETTELVELFVLDTFRGGGL